MPDVIWTGRKNANEALRVSLDTFKGVRLCDLRVVVPISGTASDVMTPTKKGVSFRVELLPEVIDALTIALAKASLEGRTGGEA